jgi:hypothetical protein
MERVITNLESVIDRNDSDGNSQNNPTDRINEKFSIMSIVISFFIIFNVLMMNMETKPESIQDNHYEIRNNSKLLEDFFIEQYYMSPNNRYSERYMEEEDYHSRILADANEKDDFKSKIYSKKLKNLKINFFLTPLFRKHFLLFQKCFKHYL